MRRFSSCDLRRQGGDNLTAKDDSTGKLMVGKTLGGEERQEGNITEDKTKQKEQSAQVK